MTAELPVVHLKIRHRATGLTTPAVATQDLLAQTLVRQGIQPQPSGLWENRCHDAFSHMFSRKACFCFSSAVRELYAPGCTIEVLAVLGEDIKSGLRQAPFAAGPETV